MPKTKRRDAAAPQRQRLPVWLLAIVGMMLGLLLDAIVMVLLDDYTP